MDWFVTVKKLWSIKVRSSKINERGDHNYFNGLVHNCEKVMVIYTGLVRDA